MKLIMMSLLTNSLLFSAGYQIPNNSVNSLALSTAYIANANGADASYYNPANMVYKDAKHEIEISAMYVQLKPINYDSAAGSDRITSKRANSTIPSLHYVSKKLNTKGVRVGFSLISPAGLTREWEEMPASATAKKYSLKTVELNPTLAIPISTKLSLGLGFRYIIASGEIALDGGAAYSLDMTGKGDATGYNLALAYKATDALNISATYRSQINFSLSGSGSVTLGSTPFTSDASIAAHIPANFIVAVAYTFTSDTTLEMTYDTTYWSVVQETNFEFENPIVEGALGQAQEKKWHDITAYRVGLTQKFDTLTMMAGFAYSPNASDEQYVTFSSPEADFLTYSLGAKYKISESFELGLSGMLAQGEERSVSQPTKPTGVNGTLIARDIYILAFGVGYRF